MKMRKTAESPAVFLPLRSPYAARSDRTDGQPGRFTNLGKLRATNGSFNYPIPANVDLTQAMSVVVYCQTFNVTITFALLESG